MSRPLVALTTVLLAASPAAGQVTFDASYGRWWHGDAATTFRAGVFGPLLGPFSWSLGISHLDDHLSLDDRTQTGVVAGLGFLRDGAGPYGLATAGLGLRHGQSDIDATWTLGGGYAVRLFGGPSVALEAGYHWEDSRVAGFWRLDPADRRGWGVQARLSFPISTRHAPTVVASNPSGPPAPRSGDVDRLVHEGGARGNTAEITAGVVRTAMDAMGAPYRWGGTTDNGFDCSGLIQFAYKQQGIILPRVSRDQVRQGIAVPTKVEDLRPGDVLGFSIEGRGVSHVGLYVGEGRFIHSASSGVTMSSLTGSDGTSTYWRRRWVVARRIVE